MIGHIDGQIRIEPIFCEGEVERAAIMDRVLPLGERFDQHIISVAHGSLYELEIHSGFCINRCRRKAGSGRGAR